MEESEWTPGSRKKTRGAVHAGMKGEEGEDRWSEGMERKTGMKEQGRKSVVL